jgi:Lar family restriction alleviation protein
MIKDKVKPKFLPCPFCGRTEDLSVEEDISEDNDKHAYACHVSCGCCGARGRNNYPIGWVESDGQAIEAWNDRYIPATIPGKEEDRVQITTDALLHMHRELTRITQIIKHVEDLLTPVKMVK